MSFTISRDNPKEHEVTKVIPYVPCKVESKLLTTLNIGKEDLLHCTKAKCNYSEITIKIFLCLVGILQSAGIVLSNIVLLVHYGSVWAMFLVP